MMLLLMAMVIVIKVKAALFILKIRRKKT